MNGLNWSSEDRKSILFEMVQLRNEKKTYNEISKWLKKSYNIELKADGIRSAINRNREKLNENFVSQNKEKDLIEDDFCNKIEEAKDKAKASKEKQLLQRLLKERGQTELMIDMFRTCIQAYPRVSHISFLPVREIKANEEAVLLFSDAQIGEEIKLEETNGFGEYNISIFKNRLDLLMNTVRSIGEKHLPGVRKLNIFMLGDNVDGLGIYRGQDHHLDILVVDQLIVGAHALSEQLINLLQSYDEIEIWGIVGNHGRIGKKGEYPTTVNWDYALYKMLEMLLKEYADRIKWIIPKSNWTIANVKDHNFLLLHGDTIKGWNGLPYYGIDRADSRLTKMLSAHGKSFRYLCLGHHHNPADIDSPNGEKILNGTMVGGSDFSINLLHTSSRPSQWFFGVDEKGITWRYKIYLDQSEMTPILN